MSTPGRARVRLHDTAPAVDPSADRLAQEAAEWIVRLTADDASERAQAHAGFEAWKQQSPRHAHAAARMEDFVAGMRNLREGTPASARPARAALDAAFASETRRGASRVKRVVAVLALCFALAVPAWLALRVYPPAYLLADLHTTTGRWQTQTLPDGTRLTLNSASAANLHFDARSRTLELVQGEILVDVAHDTARPFIVETAQGRIQALGTRFVVRRETDATVLSMIASKVSVQAAQGGEKVTVGAGQRVRITPQGIGPIENVDASSLADAWKFHQLVVQDRPLPDVLDELGRHRPGRIQYDRDGLAAIRVSAVLPLDDTDRALQLLLNSFPSLRVRTWTPYWVMVDTQASP
jgi:transmembrane sensor